MVKLERKHAWVVGIFIALLSMILLYVGIRIILGNEIITRNFVAFSLFSLLVGFISYLCIYIRWKITFWFYVVGLCIGFVDMYRAFINGLSGWGDLVGLLSLFMWVITGLVVGIVAEGGYRLYKKLKKQ